MLVLIHSSKTMKSSSTSKKNLSTPIFINEARKLSGNLKTLSISDIGKSMKISKTLAEKTKQIIANWTDEKESQTMAGEAFLGDIYSGLQFNTFTKSNREYAYEHLRIVSGLYGLLRLNDGIYPYRLELEYKLAPRPYKTLYEFWGDKLALSIKDKLILNLTSKEYEKAIIPYVKDATIISPIFKTYSQVKKDFFSVAVHSKIARGNMAAWVIKNKIEDPSDLDKYSNLGYIIDKKRSTPSSPLYITKNFEGIGLSIRKK